MTQSTDRPTILCAAFSARQIAMSARRSGVEALAVDFFGDLDLQEHAVAGEVLRGEYPDGFDGDDLVAALERLAAGRAPIGFVHGAGFEDRPELLDAIAARWPILGTGGASLTALKDPTRFSRLCAAAGVAHPQISFSAVEDPQNWLSKKIGGCGGSHVRPASYEAPQIDRYLQRAVLGERWSACLLAEHGRSFVLGFTRQWADPYEEEPYRYGGAVGPIEPPRGAGEAMRGQVKRFAVEAARSGAPIVGIASADFILSADGPMLLEINPRFGATVDVFDTHDEPLVALHLAACRGELPERYRGPGKVRAAGLAWAGEETIIRPGFVWPSYTRDRTGPPARFVAGQPLATVVAEEQNETGAVGLFGERVVALIDLTREQAA